MTCLMNFCFLRAILEKSACPTHTRHCWSFWSTDKFLLILPVGVALGKAPILTTFLVKQTEFALVRLPPEVLVKLKSGKNLGFKGIWTNNLWNTRVMLYQLSYEANWELVKPWVCNIIAGKNGSIHFYNVPSIMVSLSEYTCIFLQPKCYVNKTLCWKQPLCNTRLKYY